ncbi:GGDEF domain-containing protein [Desulfobacula phenolica]|uniref:diguanylate cyclase n=1 Tax=Desulfobacula phenolica TaxID=90732 RepID=A0A1H2GSF5_9BACT|nr:diguanylate cyclase [Desulfobacula phenolica]SDU22570.1 diguanylate cyclase (GGDEF) domain-containing protein [Desulfobacula phenolica]
MSFSDLFQREINILTQARQLIQDETYSDNCMLPEYKLMVKHYNKLLKQTRRLVKMSDIMQNDLNELNDRLEKLSSLDGLTGIPNRRCFDNAYEKEWKQAQRNGTALSIIMVDIDYFKLFNDTYGHASGDTCLKRVASALSSATKRPMDIVARYGGEEFAAVLPDTNIEGAQIVAKNMRQQVEALDIAHVESKVADHVTVSIGISSIQTPMYSSHTPETLIKVADDMLYKAKSSGRNRVCS